jgi:oligoribonuclease NrnB/cAMP/cGMP phosphodiesterase (DHH superfamily)
MAVICSGLRIGWGVWAASSKGFNQIFEEWKKIKQNINWCEEYKEKTEWFDFNVRKSVIHTEHRISKFLTYVFSVDKISFTIASRFWLSFSIHTFHKWSQKVGIRNRKQENSLPSSSFVSGFSGGSLEEDQ